MKVRISKENIGIVLCYCLIYLSNLKLLFPSIEKIVEIIQYFIIAISIAYVIRYRIGQIQRANSEKNIFLIFILFYMLAGTYSPSTHAVKTIVLSTFTNVIFTLLVYYIAQEINLYKLVRFAIITNILIVCIYLILNATMILSYLHMARRLESLTLPNPIWVARFVGDIFLLTWMQYWCEKTKKSLKTAILALLPLLLMLLIAGSKGPIVAMGLTVIFFWMFKEKSNAVKIKVFIALLIIFIGIVIAIFYIDFSKLNGYFRFDTVFDRRHGARLDSYIYALGEIPKSLFRGYGLGSWGIMYNGEDSYYYPHNVILELLFETGLIGIIPFLIMYIKLFGNKKIKTIQYAYLMSCMTMFYIVASLFSGGLMTGNKNIFIFWAMAFAACKERTKIIKSSCWMIQ